MNALRTRAATPRRRSGVRRRVLVVLAIAGPGVIAANAGNDAGGIATYASAGSQFGYRMLFPMVLVTVALVVVQEMSARLGAHTGEGLVSLIREQFSLRASSFAVLCLVVANVGLVVSEFAGIGAGAELLGVPRSVAIPFAAVALWLLVVLGSYRRAEQVFLAVTLVFLAYPVAAVLARPDWGAVATNAAWPHLTGSHAFLLLAVALVGTTVTPYMQLYQAGAVADRGPGDLGPRGGRIDAIAGSVLASVVSLAVIVATAATIGGSGPLPSAARAATALEPAAGHAATLLFALGLLGASLLAAAVVPLSTSYALAEAVGAERSVSRRFTEAPLFLGLFGAQLAFGATVALVPGDLVALLLRMQVLNGMAAPVVLGFVVVLASRRSVLGAAANGPVLRAVGTVCVVTIGALSVAVVGFALAGALGR